MPNLQREEPVVDLHLLCEEIRADRRLVLVAELVVHVPADEPNTIVQSRETPQIKINRIRRIRRGGIAVRAYWFISDVFPTLATEKSAGGIRKQWENHPEKNKKCGENV
jgi:hypothetical protein